MKIVVINSSPHSESESTSRYISQHFTDGARSAGHDVFVFDAAHSDTHPCQSCDACHWRPSTHTTTPLSVTWNGMTSARFTVSAAVPGLS